MKRLVRDIREIKPDVLFSFDPGWGYQVWRKTDHRAAAYLSADAARAAEWRLLFPGQINHEGLEAHRIDEYVLYGGPDEAQNITVDISGEHAENKIEAVAAHKSQFSSAWSDYRPELPPEERKQYRESIRERVFESTEDGKVVERFRYYRGIPDGIGQREGGYSSQLLPPRKRPVPHSADLSGAHHPIPLGGPTSGSVFYPIAHSGTAPSSTPKVRPSSA